MLMAKTIKLVSKTPAIVTYIIAAVFLIIGLTLPVTPLTFTEGMKFNEMPILQLTGALEALGILQGGLPFGSPLTPAFDFPVALGGAFFNIGALLLLLYALVTVAAIVLLIPMFVSRKHKATARKIAAVAETIVLFVLLPLVAVMFATDSAYWYLTVIAAFAVTAIMLVIQSIIYLGKSGVIKLITFLLSLIAVLFGIVNLANNIPVLAPVVEGLANGMKGPRPFETAAALYSFGGQEFYGSDLIMVLIVNPAILASGEIGVSIVHFIALTAVILVCIDLLFDMLGLGKKTRKFMLVCNLIRYTVQIVAFIALAISIFTSLGSYGLYFYLLFALTLAQLVIAIIRLAVFRPESSEETAEVPVAETESGNSADYVPVAETPVAESAPNSVIETRNVVYNVNTIYNGPSDSFIRKLTNEEKVEFARLFLEKNTESLLVIPDYVVGGDNSKFFSSIFIYLARVRSVVTDGLMSKLYEEASLNG